MSFDRILSCTRHLSDQLQSSKIDLGSAADLVQGPKSNSEYWNKLFCYVMSIAKHHSVDFPPAPRRKRLPAHFDNSVVIESVGSREQCSTSQELKVNFFFPVIDRFVAEIEQRFESQNCRIMKGIQACKPSSSTFLSLPHLVAFADCYSTGHT